MDATIIKSFLWSLGQKTQNTFMFLDIEKKSELEQLKFQLVWIK